MDPDALAEAFIEHYYSIFNSNRANLGSLYQELSMLTFEGLKIQEAQRIISLLLIANHQDLLGVCSSLLVVV
ncbi:hypothetical protein GIB67_001253 [Kingdonia uniflora]|uniref:NTF2 domain-containing protein n=1 Tax=Kingdonia uniflora TaxID=39325 RepID=A0A7J7L7N3_9MAGN|nr:hypothetical protein GIB67_001253 [Kingdonia uniflora]